MERVFSVDDILGTFWKVDSSGDHSAAAVAAAAAVASSGVPGLPGPGLMPAGMPAGMPGGELQRPIPRTGSFHRMNRSSSEWAFQEFVREQGMGMVPSNANLAAGMTPLIPGLSQVSSLDKLLLTESPSKLNLASKGPGETDPGGFSLADSEQRLLSPSGTATGIHATSSGADHRAAGFVAVQKPSAALGTPAGGHMHAPSPRLRPVVVLSSSMGGSAQGSVPGIVSRLSHTTSGEKPPSGAANPRTDATDGQDDPVKEEQDVQQQRRFRGEEVSETISAEGRVQQRGAAHGAPCSTSPVPGSDHDGLGTVTHDGNSPAQLLGHRESGRATSVTGGSVDDSDDVAQQRGGHAEGGSGEARGSGREGGGGEDYDRSEGEDELVASLEHLTDPEEIKKVKRMLSNRESARRSRKRKQAHLTDLEAQVNQLQAENAGLASRLSEIGRKYNEAAVDNRVLKSDVEALRAKVKMAEEIVVRATHMAHYMYNPHHAAAAAAAAASMPFPHSPHFPSPMELPPFYPAGARPMHPSYGGLPGAMGHAAVFPADPERPSATPPPGTFPPSMERGGGGPSAGAAAAAAAAAAAGGAGLPGGVLGHSMPRRDLMLPGLPAPAPVGTYVSSNAGWQRVSSLEQLQKRMRVGDERGDEKPTE